MKWSLCVLFIAMRASADPVPPTWDRDRLAGFREHVDGQKIFDREREKGKTASDEEIEEWERARKATAADFKKQVKTQSPQEGGPEYETDLRARRAAQQEAEKIRSDYVKQKTVVMGKGTFKRSVSEEVELGLVEDRPRYDLKRRVVYGAKSRVKTSGSSYGSGTGSLPSPSFNENPSDAFPPPPPPMPEFENPPMNNDFPPPPPPPPAFEDGGGEFPTAPAPPPGDFGDFPAPPPPPPDFGGF